MTSSQYHDAKDEQPLLDGYEDDTPPIYHGYRPQTRANTCRFGQIFYPALLAFVVLLVIWFHIPSTNSGSKEPLQDIVTWDDKSLSVNGRRIMLMSGEFHPFRLPVPGLWLDVFQKMRSMGFTGASFYVDWALLEGKPGNFSADGVFALQPFFDAASAAGIYLFARPGPYINAEVSGGGFPGWTNRVKGPLRTLKGGYMKASALYVSEIGKIIAKGQISNGGPVIVFQPENEYTPPAAPGIRFPDPDYMNAVFQEFRESGIVIPFVSNDANNGGRNAPGDEAAVDIYGHDGYPLRFNCSNPDYWDPKSLPTDWRKVHLKQSPHTPYAVPEFQGGSFDAWGGVGMDKCEALTGPDFQRVFFKNMFSFGTTILNIYMTYGGTNWGNLGHPGGYTSYDYSAVITEERLVTREKYSDAKLQAIFIESSPAYLEAEADSSFTTAIYTDTKALAVTRLKTPKTQFLVIRQDKFYKKTPEKFRIKLPNEAGKKLVVPQFGESLTLQGRDSKMLVVDYDIGKYTLAYSTAEIFTWTEYSSKTVLIIYSDQGESHELAFLEFFSSTILPRNVKLTRLDDMTVLNWSTTEEDQLVKLDQIHIYLVVRHSAYTMWSIGMPSNSTARAPFTGLAKQKAIIKGAYLIRTAVGINDRMFLTGDVIESTTIQILGGAPETLSSLQFNGKALNFDIDESGTVIAYIEKPKFSYEIPDLASLQWKAIDSLPEISSSYSDKNWVNAREKSYNDRQKLRTPTSLLASDYGYNWGYHLFRGHFQSTGAEKTFTLHTRGGSAYGVSVWLDDQFIGSFAGSADFEENINTFNLPESKPEAKRILTIVLDNMGHNQNWNVGFDDSKRPLGILNYTLSGRKQDSISWKINGNHGGEDYPDRARGPANEGGLWAERHGYHLPNPPTAGWKDSKGPTEGLQKAGIAFYSTSFDLNIPRELDLPIAIQVGTSSDPLVDAAKRPAYRLQIFVNGWQFGKYTNNIGPQRKFPVPVGIWNYRGKNWVAVSLWNLDGKEVKVEEFKLVTGPEIYSGMQPVETVISPAWTERKGAS